MSVSTPESPGPTLSTRRSRLMGSPSGWILGVCCVAQFMVILDLSIVNVALPSIQSSLEFSSPELQWVVDAYSITFAGFLLFGGRASDHFGQRRTFVIAFALFALASLAGGLASSRDTLVAARGVQGLGGALMAASSLAIITSSFQGPKLHRAIATWAAMNGLGGSAGVLFGGIITQYLSWRWVLLINPPIGVLATFVAYRVVTERRRAKEGESFDLAGALSLTAGQMVLVFGVVEAGLKGWSSAPALGPIIGGIVILGVFGVIEARFASNPLIPFKELTPALRIANNIVLLFSATIFPMWLVSSLYLQQVLGLSPLHTGLVFLPMTVVIALIATRAGKLVSRFGVKPVLGGGLLMLTAALFLLARIGSSGNGFVYIAIPGLLAAAGIAMAIVPSTIAATQGAKEGQAGLASGLVNTSRQVGGGLGLAILLILATQHSSHLIGTGHTVNDSLTAGFRLAFLIGGGLSAAAALLTFLALPGPKPELRAAGRRVTAAFAVLVAVFVALDIGFANSHGAPIGAYVTSAKTTYSYVSEPSIHPPKLHFIGAPATNKLAPGYIFTANFYNVSYPPMVGQSGPMIVNNQLQPVWFHPVPPQVVASNLSLQSYEGKPALAWWQGVVTNTGATDSGEWIVDNRRYQRIARIKGVDGWVLTLHEFLISGEDAWVSANKNVPISLSQYGGAYNGALIDSAVMEYNLRTGKVMRIWDALKHIPLSESYATLPTNGFPWDAYHINAISLKGNEDFLVSMRDTWAAYLVNIATGKIKWTLGGRDSSFTFGREAAFQWQHDVKLGPGSTVTIFDDHCCQLTGGGTYVPPTGAARGIVLNLDEKTYEATLKAQYGQEEGLDPDYMGDIQQLPDKNVFVGWGDEPYMSEFNKSGELLFEAEFPRPDLSYRETVGPWVGSPSYPPAGAARRAGGKTTVYASWNGATQVASWRVLASSGAGSPTPVASAKKSGFETAIAVPGSQQRFEVQALGQSGQVIRTSGAFGLGGRSH